MGIELDTIDYREARERVDWVLSSLPWLQTGKSGQEQLALTQFQSQGLNMLNEDFFLFCKRNPGKKFDAVVGNPPFIRYQSWEEQTRIIAFEIVESVGLRPNRLTNAWVPFLLASCLLLAPNGRTAMVIPAELLQVKYAAQLRQFLTDFFGYITIITFKKLIFPEIQQEVVLLLAQKSETNSHGIDVIELEDERGLDNLKLSAPRVDLKPVERGGQKWTQYFLTADEIRFLRKIRDHEKLTHFGDIASVDVGVVTGENQFFLLDEHTVEKYDLNRYVLPLVGRTAHLKGLIFRNTDWIDARSSGAKSYLLSLPERPVTNSQKLLEYLKEGEKKGVDKGYKCRIRKYWYSVPSIWVPDAFLYRQAHSHPKLVINEAGALVTDTLHRVKFKDGVDSRAATVCFNNSLTFAFSEVLGRSYGGGVLELEPSEAEELPIPYFGIRQVLSEVDGYFRENKPIAALQVIDDLTLGGYLGLSETEIEILRGIWEKLSNRRMQRKRRLARAS